MTDPDGQRPALLAALAAAAAAALLVLVQHPRGIALTADGWAFWQGAVSLAEGHGLVYFTGRPIFAWPPLYPALVAFVQQLAGPTGSALLATTTLLAAVQAGAATWAVLRICSGAAGRAPLAGIAAVAACEALLAGGAEHPVLADSLKAALLPLFVLALWSWRERADDPARAAATATSAALLLLAAHSSLAYVVAGATLFSPRLLAAGPRLRRATIAVATFGLPVLLWWAVRRRLEPDDGHLVAWGAGRESATGYLRQLAVEIPRLLTPGPFVAGLLALGALALLYATQRRRGPTDDSLRFLERFCVVSTLVLFGMFNLTWIHDRLGGRFLVALPMFLGPALLLAAATRRRLLVALALPLLLAAPLARTVERMHAQWTKSDAELGFPHSFVTLDSRIESGYVDGPPLREEKGWLLAPLPWEVPRRRPPGE
ncbi:MAG: hypothetical protein R2862_01510 [Thermoanaerobaculia bacterium]